ncbi:MAG: RNA-guided pseudouridylation complex pseudouridine synthase subunit Cbf5 [Candidatus Aenigmatarchaeota archaeon]
MEKLYKSVILLDKPLGLTSLECSQKIREIFSAKKSGHAGTLDPNARGVLVVALDEATKAVPVFMGADKEYEGVMHIHRDFSEEEIEKAVNFFRGKIIQKPPVKSAVSRKPRIREVYSFDVKKVCGRDVYFHITCQAGTYIRKVCSDIGEKMGTRAHLKSLVRTRAGPFSIKECVSFEVIERNPCKCLVPLEKALERVGLKRVFVMEGFAGKIISGSPVFREYVEKSDKGMEKGEMVGVFSGERITALGSYVGGERIVAKTERVFRC